MSGKEIIAKIGPPLAWVLSFGAEVWTLASWVHGGGLEVFGAFGVPEYAALSAMFGVVLAYSTWQLVQPYRPSMRFRAMSQLIDEAMSSFISDYSKSIEQKTDVFFLSSTRAKIRELAFALDDLGVPYPPLTDTKFINYWYHMFPRLLAAARAGKLMEARSLWQNMQKNSQETNAKECEHDAR